MDEPISNFAAIAHNIECSVTSPPQFSIFLLLIIGSYIIGSIPFGLLITKAFGHGDIRKIGSGNIGTTNVLRTGNKKLAALTLFFDATKGAFPFFLLLFLLPVYILPENCIAEMASREYRFITEALLCGLFAILGHCFPIWLKFKGGKGVATALGALLAAVPYAGLAACATWLITAKITKISSLSALVAVAVAPVVTLILYGTAPAMICALITLLVWIRHKDNIKRLLKGEEPKIGSGKKKDELVSK